MGLYRTLAYDSGIGSDFPVSFKKKLNPQGFFEVAKSMGQKEELSFLTSIFINIQICFYVS